MGDAITPTPAVDPNATAPAAVAAPAPVPAAAAAPAIPDTGSAQPGALQEAAPHFAAAQANADQYTKNQAAPTAPVAGPHARLFAMIQGLGVGLSAAGTSIGTGGKEGGAKEVIALQGEQQKQKEEAQSAAEAVKNAKLQRDITAFNTNMTLGQNVMTLASFKSKMAAEDLTQQEQKQTLTKGALDIQSEAYQKMLGGQLSFSQYQAYNQKAGVAAPTGAAAGAGGIPTTAISTWQKPVLDATTGAYKNDPGIQQASADFDAAQKLAAKDPDAAAQGMYIAGLKAQNIQDALGKGTASELAKSNADKAASETIGAKIKAQQDQTAQDTYNKTSAKGADGQPTEDFATWQARKTKEAETAVTQGDTTAMGAMAAEGLLTIPQIALGRQLDKVGLQNLFKGADDKAKELGRPEIIENGKPTGHYFNQNAATQQYTYVQEFNNPNSKVQSNIASNNKFIQHANDLNDVVKGYSTTNVPLFNAPLNTIKNKFGDADYTRVVAALAPVKSEYQLALAAGFAPSSADQDQVNVIMNAASTPHQIQDATQQMVHSIIRQMGSLDSQYQTHTGVHYPNMIFPDTQKAMTGLGEPFGDLQTGGNFGGTPQVVNAGTATAAPKTVVANPITKAPQTVGHKVGETIYQNGKPMIVSTVDATGRVTGAN